MGLRVILLTSYELTRAFPGHFKEVAYLLQILMHVKVSKLTARVV